MKFGALGFVLGLDKTVLDQPAAARRDLDPADLPGDRDRPVHALVPPLGAADRLGGGDGLRHHPGVPHLQQRAGALRASSAPVFGHITYIAIVALILNVAVSAVFTVIFRKVGVQDGWDETKPSDYTADPVPAPAAAAGPGATIPWRPASPSAPPDRGHRAGSGRKSPPNSVGERDRRGSYLSVGRVREISPPERNRSGPGTVTSLAGPSNRQGGPAVIGRGVHA